MQVEVLFFAELKEIFGPLRRVDVEDGASVAEVADIFSRESSVFLLKRPSLVYAVNENFETADKTLCRGDRLAVMTPMSGG